MPLQATSGAASYDAFGGGVPVIPNYIEDVFSTYLYTGNGSSQTITNGIDVSGQGGLVWLKNRTTTSDHTLCDSARGSGFVLASNLSDAQSNYGGPTLTSSGFSVPNNATIWNAASNNYVSWTFREQPKFFDVVTATNTGGANARISHNLGSVPGFVIVKSTDYSGESWRCYHRSLGLNKLLQLSETTSAVTISNYWGTSDPTSTDFGINWPFFSGTNYVFYFFAHDAGGFGLTGTDNVISCGTYTTDGSGTATVNLGYEPQFVLEKSTGTSSWWIADTMRGMSETNTIRIFPNQSAAESSVGSAYIVPKATGFDVVSHAGSTTYIYIAIRRGPMAVPTDGTKVFNTLAHTGDAGNIQVTGAGFTPDLLISKARNSAQEAGWVDRLRGTGIALFSNGAGSENDQTANIGALGMDGVKTTAGQNGIWNKIGTNNAWWFLKRSPSFFDEVCYTGTGSNRTVTHNLGVAPELMIVVGRTLGQNWIAGSTALANTEYLIFNEPAAKATGATYWNSTYPTSSVFSLGTASEVNNSGSTFVAYLFASCAGVSKVGSYTGNGTTQTINCGFGAGGVRFVMLKRTDAIGGWYVYDTARGMTVLTDPYLLMNTNAAEVATLGSVTTVSTGFALNSTILADINISGGSYIFLAIS